MSGLVQRYAYMSSELAQMALSVFANSNSDRFELTYREFAHVRLPAPHALDCLADILQMLEAIGFVSHPTLSGYLCPPYRFRHLPKGTAEFCYNPVTYISFAEGRVY